MTNHRMFCGSHRINELTSSSHYNDCANGHFQQFDFFIQHPTMISSSKIGAKFKIHRKLRNLK